ncbi:efflux RND transporter permease subunit [Heyndrickxia camelliae]|uniref:AcrB/AcrD/AcrF family protein n=1 Tax=Heyndrickxia camelliae TaxID=1707093 RepID=A0A2N3LLR5_9BACI|nr:efflux RND transporter permease subunit [Heyndrickxia camelliae]PKR85473.1 AcrB/AcrD/AcrF family protein [Heyndrickxia camelliae]
MKYLTKWAFRNKAALIVMTILTLGLGIGSYFALPMELMPEADNPQVAVATIGQGYNSQTMTQEVTEPIENAVATVKGKTDVFSTTGDGYSQVTVSFDSKTDMKEAKKHVEDAINNLKLPDTVSKPNIIQYDTSMIPVAELSIAFDESSKEANLQKLEKEILPKFESVNGVGNVTLYGKENPVVEVRLNLKKLSAKQQSINSIMSLLQGQNLSVSLGDKNIDGQMSNLKVVGKITSLDELGDLVLPSTMPNAPAVHLKDVADIQRENGQEGISRVNGKDAMAISITKESNASAVTVGKDIKKVADEINKSDDDVHAEILFSSSNMVIDSVNSMLREVLLGALFATIVIVLFLRNIRSTLITVVSIPLSLGLTLLLLWRSGITLNMLTLGGVAVAVGRLVDDSIVVVENIFRKTQKEGFSKETVIKATGEVAKAITSSTLTTIAVFLPMGLIQSSLKAFLLPFALTVTYSLLASLLVALTVVPLMSFGLLKKSKLPEHKAPKRYMNILKWNLNHKWIPVLFAMIMFVGSITLYTLLPKGSISADDATMVSVTMTYPSDTPISKVQDKGLAFEDKLLKLKGYQSIITQQGNSEEQAKWGQVSNPTETTFTVILKDNANADHFIKDVNAMKKDFPNADIQASTASFMGSSQTAITYDLEGPDREKLLEASDEMVKLIDGTNGVKKVSSNAEEKKPVYQLIVDPTKANTGQIAMQLNGLLNKTPIGNMTIDGKETSVVMDTDLNPATKNDLDKIQIATQTGMVPLSTIAKIEKVTQSSTVLHKNGKEYIRISAEINPKKLSVISADIDKQLDKLKLPKNVKLVKGGAVEQQASDFADLGLVMVISIGLVYLIMVLTFRTLRTPIAILMTLPLASIGAILGLVISRVSVDPTALLGALMLIGIVVTNAIVLIDKIKQNEEHMSIRESIVEAAATRTRPIIMTAVATICAMLPLLFTHAEAGSLVSKGLAVVVIGGLAVATVLTLFIVPVFYELLYFKKSKKQRNAAKIESTHSA